MSNNLKLIAGLDIGNGYVKGMASHGTKGPTAIDFPSCVFRHGPGDAIPTPESEAGGLIADIFDNMDVSISSKLVGDATGAMWVGVRALQQPALMQFAVGQSLSKAQQPLSSILVLVCLAGKALQAYWDENHKLPRETLKVTARIALALPITEYKDFRRPFAAQFKDGTHMVTIHNFEEQVRVEIAIEDVQVLAEGASAQFAINAKGEPLMKAMMKDLAGRGYDFGKITAADILAAQNTVGVDIGEGTVNFPVYQGGRFNPDVSMTLAHGYGDVLADAVELLQRRGFPFASRKALANFQQEAIRPTNERQHAVVDSQVAEVAENFAMMVEQKFREVMARVGVSTEIVYVYGGGATPVKAQLYPKLLRVVAQQGGDIDGKSGVGCPVLYLDSQWSRKLNREGLYMVADQMSRVAARPAQK